MKCENCEIEHDGKFGSGRFCCKKCSTSFSSNKNKEIKNSKISLSLKGRYIGLENSWYTSGKLSEPKLDICPICKSTFNKSYSKTYCSKLCYLDDKNLLYRNNGKGGYRKGSGIGKKGWYKGYWCDSSWELAFVIYNLEHNIKFERNKEGYEYLYKNELHKYYPDFILEDGTLLEIKGYETDKDKEKYKAINNNLKTLYKDDISEIVNYVITKYGKNYIYLYENIGK